jgi:hypothetical protein
MVEVFQMNDEEEHRFWRHNFDKRLDALEVRIDTSFSALKDSLDDLRLAAVRGFPDDDPLGHRRVHENSIKRAEAREKLRNDVVAHVLKGVVWATLVFIGAAVVFYVKATV